MADGILAFWFSEPIRPRWFRPDAAFDLELRHRFEADLVAVARAALAPAADARALLARVLLLDQVPRNIYRGTPRAFAYDRQARAATLQALERGLDGALDKDGRLFLYLPLEHSEELADQERSVELFRALDDQELLDYAQRHRDIVARFGRFPHRNAILRRASTPEEIAFLREPGSSF